MSYNRTGNALILFAALIIATGWSVARSPAQTQAMSEESRQELDKLLGGKDHANVASKDQTAGGVILYHLHDGRTVLDMGSTYTIAGESLNPSDGPVADIGNGIQLQRRMDLNGKPASFITLFYNGTWIGVNSDDPASANTIPGTTNQILSEPGGASPPPSLTTRDTYSAESSGPYQIVRVEPPGGYWVDYRVFKDGKEVGSLFDHTKPASQSGQNAGGPATSNPPTNGAGSPISISSTGDTYTISMTMRNGVKRRETYRNGRLVSADETPPSTAGGDAASNQSTQPNAKGQNTASPPSQSDNARLDEIINQIDAC
jgi:hypothetical protein